MSWDVYCSFHRKEQNRVSRLKIGWLDYFQQVLGLAAISGGSDGKKKSACSAEDLGLIPGSRRCPEERNGNPSQYSHQKNFMDRGARRASPWGHIGRLSD